MFNKIMFFLISKSSNLALPIVKVKDADFRRHSTYDQCAGVASHKLDLKLRHCQLVEQSGQTWMVYMPQKQHVH